MNDLFPGRNRWVNYADHVGLNYDASQIPSEWYGWLHYKTDLIPTEVSITTFILWFLLTENLLYFTIFVSGSEST